MLFGASSGKQERLSSVNETVPQVIFGGEWTTRLTFVNTRASAVKFPVQFFGADGRPLMVPAAGIGTFSAFDITIPAGGQVSIETAYAPETATKTGTAYADIPCVVEPDDACGRVAGIVMLRNRNSTRPDFEAVFSLRTGAKRGLVAFDHVAGGGTVLMVASDSRFRTLEITAAIRVANGARVALDQFTLPPRGTTLINVAERWPQSAGIRGTVELTSVDYGLIVTGLRLNSSNSFAPLDSFEW